MFKVNFGGYLIYRGVCSFLNELHGGDIISIIRSCTLVL